MATQSSSQAAESTPRQDDATVGRAAAASAGSPKGFRLGNRPPLTGIRALCMIPVVVYHSNFSTLPGAWVPLQVFFVLSGFLITAMLSAEGKRNGRVSLGGSTHAESFAWCHRCCSRSPSWPSMQHSCTSPTPPNGCGATAWRR